MTTEPTQPTQEAGSSQASAPGQGHRRRRRRRKSKSSQAQGGQPQQAGGGTPQADAPASVAAPVAAAPQSAPQGAGSQQNGSQGGGQGQGFGPGTGRKKKRNRSRDRDRDRDQQPSFQPQPGNSIHGSNGSNNFGGFNGGNGGGGGFKKQRRQQKGPRQFVGPMDHSYRAVNGNVADGPASTIPTHSNGNGGGGYYNEAPVSRVAVPVVAENAPTRIFFFLEDLFFLAKIQEASRKLGVKVEFVKGDKEVLARITDAPENERAALLVFDLNNAAVKPLTVIPKLKAKLKKSVSIIGFLSHLQGYLKMKAIEAGCDTVMPRSAFSQSLPNLLRRYGMDEEEEYYPQPV